jgi:RimJ/RimL family protein N-acetyltransferase/predicted N-acetyltransferase YhbS
MPAMPDREELRARFERSGVMRDGFVDLAIEVDGRRIGEIQTYVPGGRRIEPGTYEVGIMIDDPGERGKGIGTEATRLMVGWLFAERGATRVNMPTAPTNAAMRTVLERLGFSAEQTVHDLGQDFLLYSVTRDAWSGVRAVGAEEIAGLRPRLGEILVDCVANGASVGFLDPLSEPDADAYWQRIERAVAENRCVLIVGTLDGAVAGTVQLDVDTFPNQPHRATVSKLLVHTSARRRGLGEALMAELEREALERGRWLLTLDTATGAAARLYERMGWQPAGTIPGYALNPDGSLTDTTFYWKRLSG